MESPQNYVRELVTLCDPNYPDYNRAKTRVREIGEAVNRQGGMALMHEVHSQVSSAGSPMHGRILEGFWGGIGDWLA